MQRLRGTRAFRGRTGREEKKASRKEGKARRVRDAGEDVGRSEENSDKERGSQKEAQETYNRRKKHTRERERERGKEDEEGGRKGTPERTAERRGRVSLASASSS